MRSPSPMPGSTSPTTAQSGENGRLRREPDDRHVRYRTLRGQKSTRMNQDRYLPSSVRLIFSSGVKRKSQRTMGNVPSEAPRSFWRKLVRNPSIEADAGSNGAGVLPLALRVEEQAF